MLFRLSNGDTVELSNEGVSLSEFFSSVQTSVTPIELAADYLKKPSFKKVRFILDQYLPPDIESVQGKTQRSIICNQLKNLAVSAEIETVLNDIISNFEGIFENVVHTVKFVPDTTLKLVVEFLSIPCTKKSKEMFDDFPFLLQGLESTQKIHSIVQPCHLPYIYFMEARSETELLSLSQAAVSLGIQPLVVLVGCTLARLVTEYTDSQFRTKFKIPAKFKDGVLERLQKIPRHENWNASNVGI